MTPTGPGFSRPSGWPRERRGPGLPRRGIVMPDAGRARAAAPGRPWPDDDVVTQALATVIKDGERIGGGGFLDVLSRGRLWLPLPIDGGPVTDGSAIQLPTVVYLGAEFVPAFTSAEPLAAWARGAPDADYQPEPGWSVTHGPHVGWVANGSRVSVPARGGPFRTSWCPRRDWPGGCPRASASR